MLTRYLDAAMAHAEYKHLADGTFFGEIPGFLGLWADGETLEACQAELRSTLEDWLLLALRHDEDVPVIDGLDLARRDVA
jgi:predicted RNase H-like HicB family nuclease